MRTSISARLARLGPTPLVELPATYDTELLLQVVDFAARYQRTVLSGKIGYYLGEILTRIRFNNVYNPVEISHTNYVAKEFIKYFPVSSRFWQFVHVS